MVVFRFEVALLLGIVLLMELAGGRLGVRTLLLHLLPAGVVCLGKAVWYGTFGNMHVWKRVFENEHEFSLPPPKFSNALIFKRSNCSTHNLRPLWSYTALNI